MKYEYIYCIYYYIVLKVNTEVQSVSPGRQLPTGYCVSNDIKVLDMSNEQYITLKSFLEVFQYLINIIIIICHY